MERPELGGIVLAGGTGTRLDGVDKAGIEIAGHTLLEHVLDALTEVTEVVVVGEDVPTTRPVTFLREDPPRSGPAAGLLAGLRGFPRAPRYVAVLAVDMPLVTTATVRRLMLSAERDGAVLVDEKGRTQRLCAIYRTDALLEAAPRPDKVPGMSMKSLVADLRVAKVPAVAWEAQDVDTWKDLRTMRERLEG